jgi:hypothetical protein
VSEDGEIAEVAGEAGERLGLFRPLTRLFRRPLRGAEIGEDEYYVWGSGYQRLSGSDRARLFGGRAYEPPPPDPAEQLYGYQTVYKYHGLGPDELLPKAPADGEEMRRLIVDNRAAGNSRASVHASGDEDSPFVTVTKDRVDPVHPPGKGRTSYPLRSEFRVPSEMLFNPPRPGYGQLFREDGERYFLGTNLQDYKINESVNPFWATKNDKFSDWWSDNPYDA